MLLACPRCLRTDTLYENVTIDGWRDVESVEIVNGKPHVQIGRRRDREAIWDHVEVESYGCQCGDDEFQLRDLVKLDRDGRVIPAPNPNQTTLGDA